MADAPAHELPPENVIFGRTARMQEIRKRIERLAGTNIPILIYGPSGTGKEVISRLLHERSPWRCSPFVKLDCISAPRHLPERGESVAHWTAIAESCRPAVRTEYGRYGTLFLDEVGELGPLQQSRLSRLLQDGSFCRIRERESQKIAGRIVCATAHDLRAQVRAGTFRADLYYRVNVLTLKLPPLAERREDIPLFVEYFLRRFSRTYDRSVSAPSAEMMHALMEYHWPGNIREIENVLRQYVLFGSEEVLATALKPAIARSPELPPVNEPVSLKALTREAAKRLERDIMLQALKANSGNRKKTARNLGISYRSLLYKLKEAGVTRAKDVDIPTRLQLESIDASD